MGCEIVTFSDYIDQLVKAIISVESAGNPNAVSPVGAKGLMQLMDATGKEWHKKLDIKDPYNPFDPEQNKLIGTAYIEWLLGQFSGNDKLALAAYNGGVGYIKKKLRTLNATKYENIEPFLYKETRDYVKKVLTRLEKLRKEDHGKN